MWAVCLPVRGARHDYECAFYSVRLSIGSDSLDAERAEPRRIIDKEEDSLSFVSDSGKRAEELKKKAFNVWVECTSKPENKKSLCREIVGYSFCHCGLSGSRASNESKCWKVA